MKLRKREEAAVPIFEFSLFARTEEVGSAVRSTNIKGIEKALLKTKRTTNRSML